MSIHIPIKRNAQNYTGYSVPVVEFMYCVQHGGVFKAEIFACVWASGLWCNQEYFPVLRAPT